MKTIIQKIDALPAHVRNHDLIADLRDLESRRAADPAWQARRAMIRREERKTLNRWFLYIAIGVVITLSFFWFDPFHAASFIAQFTWDHIYFVFPAALIGIMLVLNFGAIDFKYFPWAEPILESLAIVGTACAFCIAALLARLAFAV